MILVLTLLFPVVGILGVAWVDLILLRGLFFLVGSAFFAWHFRREVRNQG